MDKEKFFNNIRFKKSFKYTMRHNLFSPTNYFFLDKKVLINDIFKKNIKLKLNKSLPFSKNKKAHEYSTNPERLYNLESFRYLFLNNGQVKTSLMRKNNQLWDLFSINFLRKEKIYTKLKYSRVPQYDIVSGGLAAVFSGFLGFLICEKFGFELLDSGDFYILFMYLVFFFFFIRFFIKIANPGNS